MNCDGQPEELVSAQKRSEITFEDFRVQKTLTMAAQSVSSCVSSWVRVCSRRIGLQRCYKDARGSETESRGDVWQRKVIP